MRALSILVGCMLMCAVFSLSAFGSSVQTIVGCCLGPSSGTVSFTSPDNGMPSSITWSGVGHVNGPTDIGAFMSASYTNYAPGSLGDAYFYFAQLATFTDIVTITGSVAPIFNFTIKGASTASNIDYADWLVYLWLTPCLNTLCGPPLVAGGMANPVNGNFSLNPANTFFGSGQYQLYIQLNARVCFTGCTGFAPAVGSNLSGTANYNNTLTLDSVTLAPDETMIGQSGINYGDLSPIPEPGSTALLLPGIAALVGASRRFRR